MNEGMITEQTLKGKYMIFKIDNEYYGIGIHYVNEIIGMQPITKLPRSEEHVKGLINLRGKIIPVVDIRIRFNKKPLSYHDRVCIIVASVNSVRVGFIVDKIAEVASINDSSILPPPKVSFGKGMKNQFVYGIGKFTDKVILLLDVERLINNKTSEKADV